jgi:hypothetical protein
VIVAHSNARRDTVSKDFAMFAWRFVQLLFIAEFSRVQDVWQAEGGLGAVIIEVLLINFLHRAYVV